MLSRAPRVALSMWINPGTAEPIGQAGPGVRTAASFGVTTRQGGRAQSLVFCVLPSGLCGRPGSASQSTKGHEHGVRVFPLGVRAV
jgi:hypothetical protein